MSNTADLSVMSWLSVSLIQFTHSHTQCTNKNKWIKDAKLMTEKYSLRHKNTTIEEWKTVRKRGLTAHRHTSDTWTSAEESANKTWFSFQKTIASRSHSILWLVWEQMPIDGRANVHHIGISFMIYAWSDYDRRCFHSHKLTDNIKIIICNWF